MLCIGMGGKKIMTLYVISHHLVDFKSGSIEVHM